MDLFILMVLIGGVVGAPDSWGYLRSAFWPYFLGKALVGWVSRRIDE